jgi:hypothetical protein
VLVTLAVAPQALAPHGDALPAGVRTVEAALAGARSVATASASFSPSPASFSGVDSLAAGGSAGVGSLV